jgi:hypothetical protein
MPEETEIREPIVGLPGPGDRDVRGIDGSRR